LGEGAGENGGEADVKAMPAEILQPKADGETDGCTYIDFGYGNVAFFSAMAIGFPKTTLLIVSRIPPSHPPPRDPHFPKAVR
jgi:hypothetical protein